jgi:hypothetical protein
MRIGRLQRAWGAEALQPVVGWKVWRVEHTVERTRLRSVLYGDLWPAGRPLGAACRRLLRRPHEAPAEICECGIHAARSLAEWDHYLTVGAESRVFGRVLLWGSVVEGSSGWRGQQARPVEIFVPAAVASAPAVAGGLEVYGVPIHLLGEAAVAPVREEARAR